MIVTDDEQTKKLFEDNITMFEAGISDGEQRVRIDVALEHDISAKESKMSDMKSNTESDNETKKQPDGSEKSPDNQTISHRRAVYCKCPEGDCTR